MPIRTCVGCQCRDEQGRLLRLVADAAGRLRIDDPRRLPGRGAWVHPQRTCVDGVGQRGLLGRSLRRSVQPLSLEELWRRVGEAMSRRNRTEETKEPKA